MVKAKAIKRDNSMFDIRGCPMYRCTGCGKRHQTKGICEAHIRRKHDG